MKKSVWPRSPSFIFIGGDDSFGGTVLVWFGGTILVCMYCPGLHVLSWFDLGVLSWFACTVLVCLYCPGLHVLSWFDCLQCILYNMFKQDELLHWTRSFSVNPFYLFWKVWIDKNWLVGYINWPEIGRTQRRSKGTLYNCKYKSIRVVERSKCPWF